MTRRQGEDVDGVCACICMRTLTAILTIADAYDITRRDTLFDNCYWPLSNSYRERERESDALFSSWSSRFVQVIKLDLYINHY